MIKEADWDRLITLVQRNLPIVICGVEYAPKKEAAYRPAADGERMWVCRVCGASVVEAAWPLHDRSHA